MVVVGFGGLSGVGIGYVGGGGKRGQAAISLVRRTNVSKFEVEYRRIFRGGVGWCRWNICQLEV